MEAVLRPAEGPDWEATERVEDAADRLLVDLLKPAQWPPSATAAERRAAPGFTLVAAVGGGVVGFVQVLEVDGAAHLEQVSVLPEVGGRGIGRRLVEASVAEARRRGYREITLRTFADVAFNAPFYASCGFVESAPTTPFQVGLVAVEERLGLTSLGRRIQMTRTLDVG